MIIGSIDGLDGLDDLIGVLGRFRQPDLAPLASAIAEIVADDVRSRLAAGETASGADFAPLAASTVRQRHGSTRVGGSLNTTAEVAVDIQADRVEVSVGWSGAQATKAAFFSGGAPRHNQPARPLQGISERAEGRINAAVDDFIRSALGGA